MPSNSVPQTQQRVPQQSGLQVQTLDGPANCRRKVKPSDNIVVHYHGTLTDGTVFDSSYQRNQPFNVQIGVGNVIQGWDQGIVGMCPGEKRRLIIPPELGYGQTVTYSYHKTFLALFFYLSTLDFPLNVMYEISKKAGFF